MSDPHNSKLNKSEKRCLYNHKYSMLVLSMNKCKKTAIFSGKFNIDKDFKIYFLKFCT